MPPAVVAAERARREPSVIREAFEAAYSASFSRLLPGLSIRIDVAACRPAIGRRPAFDFSAFGPEAAEAIAGAKLGREGGGSTVAGATWASYAQLMLPEGAVIAGPPS